MFLYTFLFSILLCLGINDPGKQVNDFNTAAKALNPDCWWNWGIYDERHFLDPKFMPSYWRPNDTTYTQAVNYAKKYPGRTWLLYNEPEGKNNGQANVPPAIAAAVFSKFYTEVKKVDPTAVIVCCGTIVSVEGVDWLSAFMAATAVRPDKWHVHIYGATDPTAWDYYANYQDYWAEYIGGKRGYYVTETCGMWSTNQTTLLQHVAKQARKRLEGVFWFGAYPEPIVPSWRCNLLNADKSRTYLGNSFINIINSRAGTPTPQPTPTRTPTSTPVITWTPTPQSTNTPVPTPAITPTVTPTVTPTPTQCVDVSILQNRITELEQEIVRISSMPDIPILPNDVETPYHEEENSYYYLPLISEKEGQ